MDDRKEVTVGLRTLEVGDGLEAEAVGVRTAAAGCVAAAALPAIVARMQQGDTFAGYDRRGEREYYFAVRNGALWLLGCNESGSFSTTEKQLFAIEGELISMTASGNFLVASTSAGLRYLFYDGADYSYLGAAPEFPTMAFGATDSTDLVETIAATKFKGEYPEWRGSLQPDDFATATKMVATAIKNLKRKAQAGLRTIEPLAMRVALRLWDDTLLWSPSVAVAGGDYPAPEAVAAVSIMSAGVFKMEAAELKLAAWKPRAEIVEAGIGNWRHLVKAVEIYASPLIDTLDGSAVFRCESSQQGQPSYFLRITPDASAASAARRKLPESSKFRLVATISDLDSLLSGSLKTVSIDIANAKADTGYVAAVAAFRGRVLATVGDRCFAGDLEVALPAAPRYESLCNPAGFSIALASCVVAVELSTPSGKAVVATSRLCDRWSQQLGGLVAYPDRRAVKISVAVTAGGKKYFWSSALVAASSGNYAYAYSPGGFTLAETASKLEFATANATERHPAKLLASVAGNPLQWEECTMARNRGVKAVVASSGYGSSWQLGRHAVYLFATDGIYLLSFGTKGDCTGATLVSRRTVSNAASVAAADSGVVFVDTCGAVCRLNGSKAEATGVVVSGAFAAGYSVRFGEIWVCSDSGATVVEHSNRFYHRDSIGLLRVSGKDFAIDGTAICTLDDERQDLTNITLRTRAIPIPRGWMPEAVVWDAVVGDADLRFEVYGENGRSCCGWLISRLKATGMIGAPLVHRLPSSRMRTLRLAVAGRLPANAELRPAKVLLRKGFKR